MAESKLRTKLRSQKQDLQRRHKEAVERKDKGKFGSIFLKSAIPEGVQFWSIGNGKHLIDVIPFESGGGIPNPNVEAGDVEYVVDLWRHRNIGVQELAFVCPAMTWNEPCPICEDIKASDYNDDDLEKIRAKRVCCYLVWVHDSAKEEKEGVKILEIAHFFLQKHLDELAVSPRGGGILTFSDLDDGKSVAFTKSGGGTSNWSFIGHQFVARDSQIPDWICDQSFPLDTCIHMRPSYEEIAEAYFGSAVRSEEEENEKQEPTRKEPTPAANTKTDSSACPAGGVFGQDIDTLDHCTSCNVWDDCFAAGQAKNNASEQQEESKDVEEKQDAPPRRVRRRRSQA